MRAQGRNMGAHRRVLDEASVAAVTFLNSSCWPTGIAFVGFALVLMTTSSASGQAFTAQGVVLDKRAARLSFGPALSVYNDDVETTTLTRGSLALEYGAYSALQVGIFADAEVTSARNFGDRSIGLFVPNLVFAPLHELGIRVDLGVGVRREEPRYTDPSLFAGLGLPVLLPIAPWLALDVGRPYAATPDYDIVSVDLGSSGYPVARVPLGIMVEPVAPLALVLRAAYRKELAPFLKRQSYRTEGLDVLVRVNTKNALVASVRFDGELKRPYSRFDTEDS